MSDIKRITSTDAEGNVVADVEYDEDGNETVLVGPKRPGHDLTPRLAPLGELKHHPKNARRGDVEMIRESLRTHDQYAPILVQRSTGFIIKGNHTYDALVAEGYETGWVVELDIDDEQAKKIMLIDNRSGEVGTYDERLLLELLQELDDLTGSGYDDHLLSDLEHLLQPPDLDEMAEALGEPPAGAFWPTLRMQVDPDVYRRWQEYVLTHDGDPSKALDALLPTP